MGSRYFYLIITGSPVKWQCNLVLRMDDAFGYRKLNYVLLAMKVLLQVIGGITGGDSFNRRWGSEDGIADGTSIGQLAQALV